MRIALAVVATSAVLAGAILPARPVAGGSPPEPVSGSLDLPADAFRPGACPFPINIEQAGKAGTIALPGGRYIFTSPHLTITVKNLSDPTKIVTLVAPGAFHQTTAADGTVTTVVTGRNVLGDPVAGFVLAIGTFSFATDAQGNLLQSLDGKGQLIDICALIE
jgi:hypothetical protein